MLQMKPKVRFWLTLLMVCIVNFYDFYYFSYKNISNNFLIVELRTPLGAIIGVLSAFEDSQLSEDQKDMVHIMTRASDVVLAVINDILDAAKLEAKKVTLLNRTFDL